MGEAEAPDVAIPFPFEPYGIQREFMRALTRACDEREVRGCRREGSEGGKIMKGQ